MYRRIKLTAFNTALAIRLLLVAFNSTRLASDAPCSRFWFARSFPLLSGEYESRCLWLRIFAHCHRIEFSLLVSDAMALKPWPQIFHL